nr:aminotransferase class IV family protein [Xanthomonas euvesicatoria]
MAATAQQLSAAALNNYGHFTTLQVRNNAALGLDLHLQRLQHDSAALFGAAVDIEAIRAQLRAALSVAGSADASVRITVFSQDFDLRDPARVVALDVLIALSPAAQMPATAARAQPACYVREQPLLKHVGTFALLQLRRQAMLAGFDDALLIDPQGRLVEGAFWNLGLWQQGRVVWPRGPALPGPPQRLLQAGLQSLGIEQDTRPVTLDELHGFDGGFSCNARGQQALAAVGSVQWPDAAAELAILEQALQTQAWQAI